MTAPTTGKTPPPTSLTHRSPRIMDIDVLRSFALFGILMVNTTYLASAYQGTGLTDPGFDSTLDNATRYLVAIAFEAKFYLLFSFLFGYSFTLQMKSAERGDARFTPRFLRRCGALLAIGALHAVVLFPGDILTTYAVLGLVLLAARRTRPRAAVRTAVILFTVTAVGYLLLAWAQQLAGGGGIDPAAVGAQAQQATEALRGSPGSVINAHLEQLPEVALLLIFFQAPAALAAFLLGLAAGKHEVLTDITRHKSSLRRIQWIGFPIGLLGGVIYAHSGLEHPGTAYQMVGLGIDVATAPLLAAAYAATVLRLAATRRGGRVAPVLAPAGRMTLTNYLMQSLVLALLFTGLGTALVGRVPPPLVALIAVALFTVQLIVCRWWLRHHRYGPVEWLLRAATNAEWPHWRRAAR
ncbi:DUF418 domain-containing protein [Streptomyces albipurpureus]|uniref:DUF418 domain-containing protein n=1 Tax=Streptomyces albipurpureus TaxID=2897419 RepID=A0ABT0UZ03_9ACTN|nr:DUF418 domain-containing protein [Streptomyces sp. CWNU-1]MCM2392543.1 DUF418 domain-containing protein [Streptomyces sp. CWNU-1]